MQHIAKSMSVSLVCSEQVVKPHSRQAVVKPELPATSVVLPKVIKMGLLFFFVKWVWLQKFRVRFVRITVTITPF
jgi:hypothetical protein